MELTEGHYRAKFPYLGKTYISDALVENGYLRFTNDYETSFTIVGEYRILEGLHLFHKKRTVYALQIESDSFTLDNVKYVRIDEPKKAKSKNE